MIDFSRALMALKAGERVARRGWNGKGMWLQVVDGMPVKVAPADLRRYEPGRAYEPLVPMVVHYPPHIAMKTATGELVPWLASVTDLMAVDWDVVDG